MRIVLISGAERGHVNPMAGVAWWLDALGTDVHWVFLPGPPSGIGVLPVIAHSYPAPVPPHTTGGPELAALVRDEEALRAWIRSLLIDGSAAQIEPFRRVLRELRPDRVAIDPMLYGAAVACHLEGLPWFGLSSSLNPVIPADWDTGLARNLRSLDDERAQLFAAYGLDVDFAVADCLSPWGTACFATRALVGDLPCPTGVHLVGPSRCPGPRGDEVDADLPDGPLIYASFGSQISWQPEAYNAIAAAAAAVDRPLVISAGALASETWASSLPGRVTVLPYAPQRAVLERAELLVTHGGANSVMEAADAGVPMALVPICNDQEHNARVVEACGTGRTAVDHMPLTALFTQLTTDPRVREAVRTVQTDYASRDGAREAAKLVIG